MDIDADVGANLANEVGTLFVEGSIRSRSDIDRAVSVAHKQFGGLDCVIANAGIHRCNTLLDISDD